MQQQTHGCDASEGIDVEKWLKVNKLGQFYDLFKSRDIAIEEIAEFDDIDIAKFATETLKLDTLSKKRFINAIHKIKQKNSTSIISANTTSTKQRHVIISSAENDAIQKLYQRFDECSKHQISIQQCLKESNEKENNLNKHYIKTVNNINITFDSITKQLINKKNELLKDIDNMNYEKEKLLKNQLNILQNEYISLVQNAKNKYELYANQTNKNINIINMIDNILNYKSVPTTVHITKPNIKFNINYSLQLMNEFIETFIIDDCDKPLPIQIEIKKVESDSIEIKYNIKKKYQISINKPIQKICIEYALIKHDDQLWIDYKEEKQYDSDSDTQSESETKSDTDSDSDSDSDSDNVSSVSSSYIKKSKRKQKKNKKKKKKSKQKVDKLAPKAKIQLIDVINLRKYNKLKWFKQEYKISKKRKKHDKGCEIIEHINTNKTYIIRMKLLNDSGWSEYLKRLYVIKTPKTASKILNTKEMMKLKDMVKVKLNTKPKWKLIFRASKDGFTGRQFHAKCDNKPNLLCLVQTDTNNVFGGFAKIQWQKFSSSYGKDTEAFIFLIRSSKKYKPAVFNIVHSQYALLYNATCGPIFGAGDIYLQANFNTAMNSYTNKHAYAQPSTSYLNGGQRTFNVKEFEVYQLKF